MKVDEWPIGSLRPYENNPRVNDDAVEAVAASIKTYGFKVPIIAQPNGVVIAGHTRLKAAQQLGLQTVPVIIADDLTDAQAKAFRLVENRAGEQATWDVELLGQELAELAILDDDVTTLDLEPFAFADLLDINEGIDEAESEPVEPEERTATIRTYNLHLMPYIHQVTRTWQIPIMEPYEGNLPGTLIGFHEVGAHTNNTSNGIHCFIDDYKIERLWNQPEKYVQRLADYPLIITPDYSLYTDMSRAMQLWNVYRSRFLGAYWQAQGLNVVPQVTWAGPETWAWCFDGTPTHSTVAISTVGLMFNQEWREFWAVGVTAALEHLEPSRILLYGIEPEYSWPKDCEIVFYSSRNERMQTS